MTPRLLRLVSVSVAALALAFALHLGVGEFATHSAGPDVASAEQDANAHAIVKAPPAAAKVPAARGAQARPTRVVPHVTLPVDSPWALPPVLVLQSRTGGRANAALKRRVLHLDRLALSPAARRSVRQGRASAGALKLLAAFPRTGGPLLVLAVDGRQIRAQETTLWMTRKALRGVPALPKRLRPRRLLLEPVASDRIDLAGPPRARPGQLRTLVSIYRTAGYQYGIDWRVLAAINRVETNLGRNTHVSSAGAVGWMQFLPSTWRRWGVDASGDGVADPYDPQDAIFSAARYLDAAGARTNLRRSIFAYNHANWYVNEILSIAASLPDSYGS
jgi:soluble lytic murein transglycosylase-like protein